MINKIISVIIFISAFFFQRVQTGYFGNNLFPQTFLELGCDLLSIVLLAFGFYFAKKGGMNNFILYIVTLIHLPITIFRVFISLIIKIDMWCDKVISEVSK